MSEVRRATLMPFAGGGGGGGAGGDAAAADAKKRRAEPLSVRLQFVLPESTESTCPVYNYKEELTAAKKRDKSKLQNGKTTTASANGLDPFDSDDDDVKRIAMKMEAKYGIGPPSKRMRKQSRRDDYADIGMGYDESDSFIDNTDGYDEMIPQNVTTLHGGFYINCGALEFKADEGVSSDLSSNSSDSSSSSEEDDDDRGDKDTGAKSSDSNRNKAPTTTGVNRKRILESSDSEADNEEPKDKTEKAEKKTKPAAAAHSANPPLPNGVQQHPAKKRKESLAADEGRKALENHKDRPPLLPPPPSAVAKKPAPPPPVITPAATLTAISVEEAARKKVSVGQLPPSSGATIELVATCSAESSVKDKVRDVPVAKQSEPKESVVVVAVAAAAAAAVPTDAPAAPSGGDSREKVASKEKDLPANLPTHISDLIRRIKDNVQKNKDANRDIFHGVVNSLLILFERKSKVLGKQSRSRIYQHFSSLMHMEKENLCKRAKSLVMAEDTKRLNTLLADLKARVLVLMVPLWEAHERETIRVTNLKTADTEETKNMRMPKRKFVWSEDTRKMLREIVMVKKRLLIYEGKTKESIEIHLNLFIKSDVQAIWPEGWMTMAALFKLCSSFEKKPALNNANQELNSSSEAGVMPPPPLGGALANAQLPKKKKKVKSSGDMPTKVLSTKDMQKFQANSVSIIPIIAPDVMQPNVQPTVCQKVKPKTSAAEILSKVDAGFDGVRDMSIIPIATPPAAHKSTIQARNTFKPDKSEQRAPSVDRQTKFVNLAHQNDASAAIAAVATSTPENLTKRMSTDYNIDSIIGRKLDVSSSSSSAVSSSKRQSTDILIPKEEPDAANSSLGSVCSSVTKVPLENFMPKPLICTEVKVEDDDEDVIILDDPVDDEHPVSRTSIAAVSAELLRRKPGPKSKTKYVDPALIKSIKSASSVGSALATSVEKKSFKPDAAPKDKKEPKNDGDDILKLMENLKELNKMTTPSKSAETLPASAVSVIAFNKNFAKSPTQAHTSSAVAAAAATTSTAAATNATKPAAAHEMAASGLTFNDVYQRHFLNSLSSAAAGVTPPPPPPSAPSTAKSYNSAHTSSSSAPPDKYYTSNNNYTTAPGQQPTKYKNNYQPHTGTYNLMDDMLANFITEYAYPKTANHKQKPTQK